MVDKSFKERGVYNAKEVDEVKKLMKFTKKQLTAIAEERGVAVNENSTKLEIVKALSKLRGE